MGDVKIKLQAEDQTGQATQSASGNLKKFKDSSESAKKGVESWNQGMQATQKQMASFTSTLSQKYAKEIKALNEPQKTLVQQLGDMKAELMGAGAVLVGFGVAAKQAFDFANEGAQILRLKEASGDLAVSMGADMDKIVSALIKASLGTVSETEAMTSASRAMMLGVSDDSEKLAELMQVAALRGRAMGLSTSQAFSDIVTGIGRMSPLILDNLGIVIDATKRYEEYAEANGIAASEIDSATKRQILLNGVLQDGREQLAKVGGLTLDAAGSVERMQSAWKNVTDELKMQAAPALQRIADVIYLSITAYKQLIDVTNEHAGKVADSAKTWSDYYTEMKRSLEVQGFLVKEADGQIQVFKRSASEAVKEVTGDYELLTQAQFENAQATERINKTLSDTTATVNGVTISFDALSGGLTSVAGGYGNLADKAAIAANEQDLLRGRLAELQTLVAGSFGKEIDNFKEKFGDLTDKAEDLRGKIADLESKHYLTEAQKEELASLRTELSNTEEAMSSLQAAHQQQMNTMMFNLLAQKAQADGVLSETEMRNLTLVAETMGLVDEATASAMMIANNLDLDETSVVTFNQDLETLRESFNQTAEIAATEFGNLQGAIDGIDNENLFSTQEYIEFIDTKSKNASSSFATAVSNINASDNNLETGNIAAAAGDLSIIAATPRNMVFTITTYYNNVSTSPGGGGGSRGRATGVEHFVVPQGYNNDGYLMPLTSGEIVTVKSPGQSAAMMQPSMSQSGGGSSGGVTIQNINIYEAQNGRQVIEELENELRLRGIGVTVNG